MRKRSGLRVNLCICTQESTSQGVSLTFPSCQSSCRLNLKSEKFKTMAERENAKTTTSHKNAPTKYRRDEQKSSQPRWKWTRLDIKTECATSVWLFKDSKIVEDECWGCYLLFWAGSAKRWLVVIAANGHKCLDDLEPLREQLIGC